MPTAHCAVPEPRRVVPCDGFALTPIPTQESYPEHADGHAISFVARGEVNHVLDDELQLAACVATAWHDDDEPVFVVAGDFISPIQHGQNDKCKICFEC